jgi:polysaccharide transporter, PST family
MTYIRDKVDPPPKNVLSEILKRLQNSHETRNLFSNALYLYILQFVNFVIPLISFPYLIRVLGTEKFGVLAFYGSLMSYFQIIVDYGFNLVATRQVSIYKNDRRKISTLFFSVLTIKASLVFVCMVALIVILSCFHRFQAEAMLCIILFLSVAGSILFPVWFFQGMEKMGYIAVFNLASRLGITVLYFFIVKCPEDYFRVACLNTAGTWIIGIVSLALAIQKFKIRFVFPDLEMCYAKLREGFQIFVSQLSVTLFTNTNTFFLGLFANDQIVGKYAIAEKIVRAVISLTAPIGSAIYPRTAVLFTESREKALRFLRQILLAGSAIFGMSSVCLFLFSNYCVQLVTGSKSDDIAFLIRIMSILPLSVFLDNIYGTQIMLNINLQKQFMQIILGCGILSVTLLILLVPQMNAFGSATSFLISELALLLLMIFAVRRTGISLLKRNIPTI